MPSWSQTGTYTKLKISVRCTCHTAHSSRRRPSCKCKISTLPASRPGHHRPKHSDRASRARSTNRKGRILRIYYIVRPICPGCSPFRIRPVVRRYFYQAPEDIRLAEDPLVLRPHQFVNDAGEPAVRFMDFGREGYFNLYINGVMQEGNLYQATADKLTIATTGQTIIKGTPIILESVGFRVESAGSPVARGHEQDMERSKGRGAARSAAKSLSRRTANGVTRRR